jgi:hypothetical protein
LKKENAAAGFEERDEYLTEIVGEYNGSQNHLRERVA